MTRAASDFLLPLPPGEGGGAGVWAAERSAGGAARTQFWFGKRGACPPPHPGPLPEGEGGSGLVPDAMGLAPPMEARSRTGRTGEQPG